MNFPSLKKLHLKALRIGEKLGDLVACCKNPSLKELNLEYNGIEPEYCLLLTMIINFEHLEHLNISHNWIGMHGIERLYDHFKMFKNLKVLNMSSNKLFMMPDRRTENLKDMLDDIKDTIEELNLSENSMENEDFLILIQSFIKMPRLKVLNLNVNRIEGPALKEFLDLYIANEAFNRSSL